MNEHQSLRVVLVIPAYVPALDYGGPVGKVRQLAAALRTLGVSVEIWTADYGPERSRVPNRFAVVDDIPVRYLRRIAGYHWSPIVPQARLVAAHAHADIAHSFGLRDGLTHFAAQGFRAANIPYVVETLGMHAPMVRGLGRKRFYDRTIGDRYIDGSAGLIVTSEREQLALHQVFSGPVWLRYNPIPATERPGS